MVISISYSTDNNRWLNTQESDKKPTKIIEKHIFQVASRSQNDYLLSKRINKNWKKNQRCWKKFEDEPENIIGVPSVEIFSVPEWDFRYNEIHIHFLSTVN